MSNSHIAKSGWIYRQSTILKKWKRNWVELHQNGALKYFEAETNLNAEDVLNMPIECIAIKSGTQVEGISPPTNYYVEWLFSIQTTSGKSWVFCGESLDDMKAWVWTLEQTKMITYMPPANFQNMDAPPPYTSYVDQGYFRNAYQGGTSVTYMAPNYPVQPTYYGYQQPYGVPGQQTTVIYRPSNRRYGGTGGDMAMGMLAGAAIGSMLWAPLLWW